MMMEVGTMDHEVTHIGKMIDDKVDVSSLHWMSYRYMDDGSGVTRMRQYPEFPTIRKLPWQIITRQLLW
jgi:hypothetical protein